MRKTLLTLTVAAFSVPALLSAQSFEEVDANADGSITLHFGPENPGNVPAGNFVQTVPGRGWFQILRFYSPTKGFFDKSWRAGEIDLVK